MQLFRKRTNLILKRTIREIGQSRPKLEREYKKERERGRVKQTQ